jgi:hypothetical protein
MSIIRDWVPITDPEELAKLPDKKKLPVLKELLHCKVGETTKYGEPLTTQLWIEYRHRLDLYRKDFSCGKGVSVKQGRFNTYEPADLYKRISEALIVFLQSRGVAP